MTGLLQHPLDRIINVHWGSTGISAAGINLTFSVIQQVFYLGDTPAVATLSVSNLPMLTPDNFQVNITEGFLTLPPGFVPYYGGASDPLSIPDGETATLTGGWNFQQQLSGLEGGNVQYTSQQFKSGKWQPFLGAKTMQLKIAMKLRPLSFVDTGAEDNHYTWSGSADFVPGIIFPGTPEAINQSKTGRAESAQTLTFSADFFMGDKTGTEPIPPTCTLTVTAG